MDDRLFLSAMPMPTLAAPLPAPALPRRRARRRNRRHQWHKGAVRWMAADPCFFCGYASDTWDHVQPIARDGRHQDNVARACGACNTHKGETPLLQWLVQCRASGRFRMIARNGAPPITPEERGRRRLARRQRTALEASSTHVPHPQAVPVPLHPVSADAVSLPTFVPLIAAAS